MAAYEYTALDASGQTRKGVLESDSARQARQLLREKEWVPLAVEAASFRPRAGVHQSGAKISGRDLVLLTRQLATLVASGLPVDEALKAASEQSASRKATRLLLDVRASVLEGGSLAEGIREHPASFPRVYSATIAAGEHSGHLDVILERLADYVEATQESRQKLQLALMYPVILLSLSFLIVVGLLAYVVPRIVTVFTDTGQELPALTRGLIAVSEFFAVHSISLAVLLVVAFVLGKLALRHNGAQLKFDALKLRLPLLGGFVRGLDTARFIGTLGILSTGGTSLTDGMRVALDVVENRQIKSRLKLAVKQVVEGGSLRASLTKAECFPPMTLHMIGSGEASGELDKMLNRTAASQQKEIENQLAVLLKLFEPLLLLVMGGIVMLIVLAILLPIMNMNRLIA